MSNKFNSFFGQSEIFLSTSILARICLYGGLAVVWGYYQDDIAYGQIAGDSTVGTEIEQNGEITNITGGTIQGGNLFHSFQEFSVPTGNTAYFNNSGDIDRIIGRVTGNAVSEIDGLLRANDNADLILLNPNGILFGANARLEIGGSFLASTANSLSFADGTVFSTEATNSPPLLTVSVPLGLQLGTNSGAIAVEGVGHDIGLDIPIFSPFNRQNVSGIKLQTGGTIGLVGNGVSLDGGVIASETGSIEIGSVSQGTVGLNLTPANFSLDYEQVNTFGELNLQGRSLLDTSGNNSGAVALWGGNINFTDGSAVLIQNQGETASGALTVKGNTLSLTGVSDDGIIGSGLYTEALGTGAGGKISVEVENLEIAGGGAILTDSFSPANSGNIEVKVANDLLIAGFAEINPNKFSIISAQAYSSGDAGAIAIDTNTLTAAAGGNVASVTGSPSGTGSGGNVMINATESIVLSGINPIAFAPSQITAGSGSAGNAGNVTLNTQNLTLEAGGRVDASATATGNAGNLAINASESILVTGTVPNSRNPSLITASANILDPELRQLFNLPDRPSGDAGSINIATAQLQVTNGGQITARNEGTGNAGDLKIQANTLDLNNNGGITAAVEFGSGGLIELDIANAITLNNGSQISNDNLGLEAGGKIAIAADSLSISDRSFITTTTFNSGSGGDITLNIADSMQITGTGFTQFQETFQANSLNGSLQPGTRGTGVFIGTAADGVAGSLEVNTNSLSLLAGGIIFAPIFAGGVGGDIQVNAQNIDIAGSALQISAGVDSTSSAVAGDISIDTQKLLVREGGTIVNATFGGAAGGDIIIDAANLIELTDTPTGSRLFTGIYANTSIGRGPGGDVTLTTKNLAINDGLISSTTGGLIDETGGLVFLGGGNGGNIVLQVQDTIDIQGVPTDPRFASGVTSSSFTDGAAGNIEISTTNLLILDGSEIAATAINSGNGGSIKINATNSSYLVGTTTINNMQRGGIVATSGRSAFPEVIASGASGDISINTGSLTIQEGASIDVQSLGTGRAGELNIQVDNNVVLDREGAISAATNANTGGNIAISANNIFSLGNSTITARAKGSADGGNIDIQGRNLVLLESSRLTADANTGQGGSIDILAKGLFVCQECIISASSRLGVDGVVRIDTLEPEPDFGIVEVPIRLTQPEETVAQACSAQPNATRSRFTITGRGGLPTRPSETLSSQSLTSFNDSRGENIKAQPSKTNNLPRPARNWYQNSQGEIILTAQSWGNDPRFNAPDCHVR